MRSADRDSLPSLQGQETNRLDPPVNSQAIWTYPLCFYEYAHQTVTEGAL